MVRRLAMLAFVALPACGLPLADRGNILENTCENDDVCGPGNACVDDGTGGFCVSTTAQLQGLIVQVDVPSGANYGAGTSSLLLGIHVNGGVQEQALAAPPLKEIKRGLQLADSVNPRLVGCGELQGLLIRKPDGTIPVEVDAHPVTVAAGIPMTTYSGESNPANEETNAVTLKVPEGDYRVYVRPILTQPDSEEPIPDCDVPPALFTSMAETNVMLEQPTALRGTIVTGGLDLTGWTLDMVEKQSGRVISTVQKFEDTATPSEVVFDLLFWNELIEQQGLDPVLRLMPPAEATALGMPVPFWHLKSVALSGYDNVSLDVAALAAVQPVAVTGVMYDTTKGAAVAGTVVVQSTSLDDLVPNISYRTTLQTDAEGLFSAQLLPGLYTVVAVPSSSELAITTESNWQVSSAYSSSVQTLELSPKTILSGKVRTPQGEHAYAMPVFAQPSALLPQNYLQSQFADSNELPVQAGSDTTNTVGDGTFELRVDQGNYDLFVRPPEESSIPWLVEPRLNITHTMEIPEFHLTHPVVLTGQVRAPDGGAIGNAAIRAWMPLCEAEEDELLLPEMVCRHLSETGEPIDVIPTAIQVGETTADGNGGYRLLLPPSISQ